MNRPHLLLSCLALVGAFASSGCLTRGRNDECIDLTDCESTADALQGCLGGECEAVECHTSSDCAVGAYCSDDYACVPGCEEDGDCRAGQECSNNVCIASACRTANLDCYPGEFCNNGACERAQGAYCGPCDSLFGLLCRDQFGNQCGCDIFTCQGDPTLWEVIGHTDCGGAGSYCLGDAFGNTFCGVDCAGGQECPAGYTCGPVVDQDQNVIGMNCTAPCDQL